MDSSLFTLVMRNHQIIMMRSNALLQIWKVFLKRFMLSRRLWKISFLWIVVTDGYCFLHIDSDGRHEMLLPELHWEHSKSWYFCSWVFLQYAWKEIALLLMNVNFKIATFSKFLRREIVSWMILLSDRFPDTRDAATIEPNKQFNWNKTFLFAEESMNLPCLFSTLIMLSHSSIYAKQIKDQSHRE